MHTRGAIIFFAALKLTVAVRVIHTDCIHAMYHYAKVGVLCERDPAFEFAPRGAFILHAALDFCCQYVRLQIHISLEGGFTLPVLCQRDFA